MSAPDSLDERPLHFLDYWRVIQNRKTLIFTLFFVVLLSAAVATWFQPRIYRASITIQVVTERKDIDVFEREGRVSYDPYFQQTQFESIKQRDVLYPVIESLKLGERWGKRDNIEETVYPTDYAYIMLTRGMLDVAQVRNTPFLALSIESRDKAEAIEICNAIAQAYRDLRLKEAREPVERGLIELEKEVQKADAEREKARAEVERIRVELGITELPGSERQASPMSEMLLQKKESDLSEARLDLLARRNRLEQIRTLTPEQLQNALSSLGLKDESIQSIQGQYFSAEAGLTQLKNQGYDINHPRVIASEALVSKLRQQLDDQIAGIRQGLEVDLNTAAARVAQMEKDLEEYRGRSIKEKTEKYSVFREAQRRFENAQVIFDAVQARFKQRGIEAEMPSSPVIIRSPNGAEAFPRPVKPNWLLNMALATAVGIILGVATAFFIEYLDTSVKTIEDVERSLGLQVLAVIPKDVVPLNHAGPHSPHAEGYRILRAKVEFLRSDPAMNSLTIVSGGPGEGKSTTLFNLAWVCAAGGLRTLLIDADLRRPTLHHILGVESRNGLADLLTGRLPLENAVFSTPLETLHFMPSGARSDEAISLMNSTRMAEIIEDAKSRYDWVFVDAPPILGVSDASVLARAVDCTVIVVQHRRYPIGISQRVKQTVVEVGGGLLGVVLNQVDTRQHDTYAYYNAYYTYYDTSGKKVRKPRADRDAAPRQAQPASAQAARPNAGRRANGQGRDIGNAEDF